MQLAAGIIVNTGLENNSGNFQHASLRGRAAPLQATADDTHKLCLYVTKISRNGQKQKLVAPSKKPPLLNDGSSLEPGRKVTISTLDIKVRQANASGKCTLTRLL